jgi:hypothetical protein
MLKTRVPILLQAGALMLFSPSVSTAQEWSFEFELYALGANIEGDASVGRLEGAEVDIDMSDILEVLDIAAMGHFEVHNSSGWGVALDYGFMDLSADISGPRGGILDARVRQGILEALLVRRKPMGDGHLDFTAGVRWWDNDIEVDIDPVILPGTSIADIEENWVDAVVGLRWWNPLSDRWTLRLQGDVGGLGLQSDFTGVLAGGFKFKMTRSIALDLRYKALWVDYEAGDPGQPGSFGYNTTTHGPLVGIVINF